MAARAVVVSSVDCCAQIGVVVVGSMLIHADGVDFTVLKPTWLAVGLFIALPALSALTIAAAVDRIGRPGS